MDNKLSELSKPVGFAREEDIKLMQSGKLLSGLTIWRSGKEALYSQEYVSALLAELEAKDKRIAELEGQLNEMTAFRDNAVKKNARRWEEILELRAKLATPVRLPTTSGRLGVAYTRVIPEVIEAIRAAGFKVEGDE